MYSKRGPEVSGQEKKKCWRDAPINGLWSYFFLSFLSCRKLIAVTVKGHFICRQCTAIVFDHKLTTFGPKRNCFVDIRGKLKEKMIAYTITNGLLSQFSLSFLSCRKLIVVMVTGHFISRQFTANIFDHKLATFGQKKFLCWYQRQIEGKNACLILTLRAFHHYFLFPFFHVENG